MEVCEIWDVLGRLDHPIDYAENPEKTANQKYSKSDLQAMMDVMEYATNKDKTEQRFIRLTELIPPILQMGTRKKSLLRLPWNYPFCGRRNRKTCLSRWKVRKQRLLFHRFSV